MDPCVVIINVWTIKRPLIGPPIGLSILDYLSNQASSGVHHAVFGVDRNP
jgi:hypothetical protein